MKNAEKSMAHLYVWDAVVAILEGGCSPGRESAAAQRAVDRVIKICKAEMHRCLNNHDAAMAAAAGVSEPREGMEWSRGYYCAVAALLRENGAVTTEVRNLFDAGGGHEQADAEDVELFRAHGLMGARRADRQG